MAQQQRAARRLAGVILVLAWGGGCGDPSDLGHVVPVSGRVTLDNEPVTARSGTVVFVPDAEKGNQGLIRPAGNVDGGGTYTLFTRGRKGAPAGWYKVVVTATAPLDPVTTSTRRDHPRPRILVPQKYGDAGKTDLSIEVVEKPGPGAYDLKLTR
jgi:hypothetical protein